MQVADAQIHSPCPACGARVTLASSALNRKIRCPKCRQIVVVNETSGPVEIARKKEAPRLGNTRKPSATPLDNLTASLDEIGGALKSMAAGSQTRKFTLDAAAETLDAAKSAIAALEESVTRIAAAVQFRSMPELETRQRETLLRLLHTDAPQSVTFKVLAGNEDARRFAEFLQTAFRAAGWIVSDIGDTSGNTPAVGLALAAGVHPFPVEVTKIYRALTAAGLSVSSHMDPNQVHENAVLIVGAKPRA